MLCKLRHQGQQPSIRIGYLPISDHLLAMVAHQHHNPQDYSMLLRRFLSWDSLVRCLKDASLDVAFIMAPLAMSLRNQHLDIKYLLDGHHDGQALTVSSVLNSCPAFGTKMALPYSISTHRLFMNLLFGLDSRTKQDLDNSTLFISPSYVLNSLRKHEIDAFFCSEPWNTKSAFQGTGRIIARSKDLAPGHICCILVGRTQFANSNPELLNRYVHDLLQAGKYITTHPQQGAAIQSCYTGIDLDIAKHILTNRHITFEDLTPEPSRVESIMGLALEAGLLDKPCDLQNFIQPPKS
jgi:NitT/TauT family transport system substrate-binding protein